MRKIAKSYPKYNSKFQITTCIPLNHTQCQSIHLGTTGYTPRCRVITYPRWCHLRHKCIRHSRCTLQESPWYTCSLITCHMSSKPHKSIFTNRPIKIKKWLLQLGSTLSLKIRKDTLGITPFQVTQEDTRWISILTLILQVICCKTTWVGSQNRILTKT